MMQAPMVMMTINMVMMFFMKGASRLTGMSGKLLGGIGWATGVTVGEETVRNLTPEVGAASDCAAKV